MAKKSIYTKKLGLKVARDANPFIISGKYHVISGISNKWSVVSEGSTRPVRVFLTQYEAITFAKKYAQKKTGNVIIHAKTGHIRDTISYAK